MPYINGPQQHFVEETLTHVRDWMTESLARVQQDSDKAKIAEVLRQWADQIEAGKPLK